MASSSTIADEAVTLLSALDVDIQKLDVSLPKNLSLQWCTKAINLLRKMHLQFLQFVGDSEIPKSWDGSKPLDDYLKESLNVLDLCNLLKSAVSRMNRYRMTVDFAVKKLSADGFSGDDLGKIEIEKLERESKKLRSDEKWRNMNISFKSERSKTRSKDKATRVMCAIRSTMKVMSVLLCATISHPISVFIDEDKEVHREFPQLQLLSVSILKLLWCFYERLEAIEDNSRPFLCENVMVQRAVLDVKEQILKGVGADKEKAQKSIDQLRSKSEALKQSLEIFEAGVNELFDEVLDGRNKVLGMVSLEP